MIILDDRPSNHPEVVARRKAEWNALPKEVQEEIDKRVQEGIKRILARKSCTTPIIGKVIKYVLSNVSKFLMNITVIAVMQTLDMKNKKWYKVTESNEPIILSLKGVSYVSDE